jgi:hypothetical protein
MPERNCLVVRIKNYTLESRAQTEQGLGTNERAAVTQLYVECKKHKPSGELLFILAQKYAPNITMSSTITTRGWCLQEKAALLGV